MMDIHIVLDEEHYRYLQQRADSQGTSVEVVVADLIDADITWQRTLADDPMAALFGEIGDSLGGHEIDAVVYSHPTA